MTIRWAVAVAFVGCGGLGSASCGAAPEGAKVSVDLEPGYQLERVDHGGMSLLRPSGSRVLDSWTEEGEVLRVVGPMVAVRPIDKDRQWSGAAYSLEVRSVPNPEGHTAREFAEGWFGDAAVSEQSSAAVSIGGRAAYRVATFGGDSEWVHLVAAGTHGVTIFTYNDAPVANNPLAEIARDAITLMLGTVRWYDEGE